MSATNTSKRKERNQLSTYTTNLRSPNILITTEHTPRITLILASRPSSTASKARSRQTAITESSMPITRVVSMEACAKLPLEIPPTFLFSLEFAQTRFLPVLPSTKRDGGPVKYGRFVIVPFGPDLAFNPSTLSAHAISITGNYITHLVSPQEKSSKCQNEYTGRMKFQIGKATR